MPQPPFSLKSLLSLFASSTIVAFGGGLAAGWCVSQFGERGAPSLAALGALAGYVWRRFTRSPSKVSGICLAIATCLAFLIAETCWLHWNTRNGEPGWWAAMSAWPAFLREYTFSALVGAACAAIGAWCAFDFASTPNRDSALGAPP